MHKTTKLRRWLAAAGSSAVLASVAACGGSGGDTNVSDDEVATVEVGDIQGTPASFLLFGKRKGIFADHDLKLEVKKQQGGAAIIPGLVSGELDIGGSNIVSVLLGRSKGLPIQIISAGTSVGKDAAHDFSGLIVAKDSTIESADDLAGKTIAVNTLKNVNDVVIKSALEKRGVDVSGLHFVEMGFPDMLAAVEKHQVDAAAEIEPFVTVAKSQGARVVLHPYVGAQPGLEIGTYTTSKKFIAEHGEVVKRFQQAATATAKYISAHPDEYRKALPQTAGLKKNLAGKVTLPVWTGKVDMDSLEFFADNMVKYGLVDKTPDTRAAVHLK